MSIREEGDRFAERMARKERERKLSWRGRLGDYLAEFWMLLPALVWLTIVLVKSKVSIFTVVIGIALVLVLSELYIRRIRKKAERRRRRG